MTQNGYVYQHDELYESDTHDPRHFVMKLDRTDIVQMTMEREETSSTRWSNVCERKTRLRTATKCLPQTLIL